MAHVPRVAVVTALALFVVGCRATTSCPRFAAAHAGTCGCTGDGVPLLGGCVSRKTMDDFCGPDARYEDGACAFREQRPPQALPKNASCPRMTTLAAGKCVPRLRCGPGEVADASKCRTLLSGTPDRYVVDVGAWARAAFGRDGGAGSEDFCAPLLRAGGPVTVRIDLFFQDNDVSQARATFSSQIADARTEAAETLLDERARPFLRALEALGGEASAGSVSLTVTCTPE